ncbi:MAG TPA: hypothetical protein VII69_10490 [Candidatus Eremiobacteraceae bacterium]
MQENEHIRAYVATHLFLESIYNQTRYEDLMVLVSGMSLSSDGQRSIDPAMLDDWTEVVGSRKLSTRIEAFAAARDYLVNWYEIGPQDEIKAVIDSMETGDDGRPVLSGTAEIWDRCWASVCEDFSAGEPFKTVFSYATSVNGKPGRMERRASDGFLEFVED